MSSSASTDTHPTRPTVGATALAGAGSAIAALAGNLAVLGIATLAGADMIAQPSNQLPLHVGVVLVTTTTVVPLLAATALLLPARRWAARGWRALAVTGLVLGVGSVVLPLTVQAETGTRLALAVMHVITGVVWFLVVRRAAARFWAVA